MQSEHKQEAAIHSGSDGRSVWAGMNGVKQRMNGADQKQ